MKLNRLIVATLLALGALVMGTQSPASADAGTEYSLADCDPGDACLFDTKILSSGYYRLVLDDRDPICYNIPDEWDNRMNKVNNRSSHSLTFYTGNVCNGELDPFPILPGQTKNFGAYGNADEANSVRFSGGTSGCLSEAPCFAPVAYELATGYARCALHRVCLFTGNSGGGTIYQFASVRGSCIPAIPDNSAISFYNHRGDGGHVQFYEDPGCTGRSLAAGDLVPDGGRNDFPCPRGIQGANCMWHRVSSIWYNSD